MAKSHEARRPDPIDVHVGSRIAEHRRAIGMSQEKLGSALGITFQQVQKYEKGTNRIGAGRLHAVSKALNVPVSTFFEGLKGSVPEGDPPVSIVPTKDGIELMRYFVMIEDPNIRRRVILLVQAIAGN